MKRIVITGAAGGIGSATVALLRARGCGVVGLDLAGADIECDVRSQASVDAAVAQAVEQLGGLDVLINNAGLGTPQRAADAPDDAALAVLDVNLVGPWRVTSAALPRCASPAAASSTSRAASPTSRFRSRPRTRSPSAESSPTATSCAWRRSDRIDVTTVYPGYIRTPITRRPRPLGVPLEGAVPVEDVADAARTLVRAALGEPARDLATTRAGTITYAIVRTAPRRLVDAITRRRMASLARRGHFAEDGLAGAFARRISR